MTKNDSDKRYYNVPPLRPDSHPKHEVKRKQELTETHITHVLRERLILARPMAAFPKN